VSVTRTLLASVSQRPSGLVFLLIQGIASFFVVCSSHGIGLQCCRSGVSSRRLARLFDVCRTSYKRERYASLFPVSLCRPPFRRQMHRQLLCSFSVFRARSWPQHSFLLISFSSLAASLCLSLLLARPRTLALRSARWLRGSDGTSVCMPALRRFHKV
jgi:hypothetical protein